MFTQEIKIADARMSICVSPRNHPGRSYAEDIASTPHLANI